MNNVLGGQYSVNNVQGDSVHYDTSLYGRSGYRIANTPGDSPQLNFVHKYFIQISI